MKARQTVPFLLLLAIPTAFFPPVQHTAHEVRTALHEAISPLWASAQFVSGNLLGGMRHAREFFTIYRDYQVLQEEVESLRRELQLFREVEKENQRLGELLNLKKNFPAGSLVGHIITRQISHWFRWVILDIGSRDGVRDRMALVTDDGVVGRIMDVGETISQAILLTDPESRVSAMVQNSRAVGMVSGEGLRDRLRMSLIPLDSEIKIGDSVITSGLGGIYPKGLPIGQVTTVGTDRDGMHLFAYVEPEVDFNILEEVLCIAYYPPDSPSAFSL